jgi:chromatin remodeling complex protein RSC6
MQTNTDTQGGGNEVEDMVRNEFVDLLATLSTFKTNITVLQNRVRGLEKTVNKRVKRLKTENTKNKNKGTRKPSGFAVPTRITDELCVFMDRPIGTRVARTEVTRYIIGYIQENKLQEEANKKVIAPDSRLHDLLDVKDGDEVTYFNIQRYMNRHFVKSDVNEKCE